MIPTMNYAQMQGVYYSTLPGYAARVTGNETGRLSAPPIIQLCLPLHAFGLHTV